MKEYDDKVIESIKCFEKTLNQITDLLIDAYKWKKIAHCTDNEMLKEKYERISDTLHSLYVEQHEQILHKFETV